MEFTVKISVTLKESVNDPQGSTVHQGLERLGFTNLRSVRVGKYIELKLEAPDSNQAQIETVKMCEKLLVNSVIESKTIEINLT